MMRTMKKNRTGTIDVSLFNVLAKRSCKKKSPGLWYRATPFDSQMSFQRVTLKFLKYWKEKNGSE